MKKRIAFSISVLILLALSCKDDPCFKGAGDSVTEKRSLKSDIRSILLYDNIRLDIYIDTVNFVEITGGENIIDFIMTDVDGTELSLRNENKCSFLRDFDQEFKVRLHISDFSKLYYNGSGNVTMHDTLVRNDFTYESESGAGDLKLLVKAGEYIRLKCVDSFSEIIMYGSAPDQFIYNDGTGWIRNENLSSIRSYIENKSTGDCIVTVKEHLQCSLIGIGNIRYHGDPFVNIIENSGKGSVIKEK